ncbi:MAG: hypothetical protein KGY61_07860 [Desulfobacterales bacterium]|nr:hypothetical protein [Desulfobacterales bacterium]
MKNSYGFIFRFLLYTLLVVCFGAILNYIAGFENTRVFKEGVVEWLQLFLLGVSAVICLWIARQRPLAAYISPIIAAVIIIIAMLRECDRLLNYYMPVTNWKLPVVCLSALVFFLAFYKRRELFSELRILIFTPFFSLMWAGLVVVVYGQLIGHGEFLEPLLQADYVRDHKRIMEECFEMLGYVFIFFGAIEFWWEAKTMKPFENERIE